MEVRTIAVGLALAALSVACGATDTNDSAGASPVPTEYSAESSPGATTAALDSPDVDEANEAASILAVAASYRIADENSFGGVDVFSKVFIIDRFGIDDGQAMLRPDPDSAIDESTRRVIETELADTEVVRLAHGTPASERELLAADGLVAFVTLAVPDFGEDRPTVTSNLTCDADCGIGGTHELARNDAGEWEVTGTVGVRWIA